MRLFCAYAYTGEDIDILTKRMRLVIDTLNANGHSAYCNLFNDIIDDLHAKDDLIGIFNEAFQNLEKSEALVAIVTSPGRSVGQIMEIGVAMSQKKPVFLFEHLSAKGSTYMPRLVDKYFQWNDESELRLALARI